jgi:hypothetical protein
LTEKSYDDLSEEEEKQVLIILEESEKRVKSLFIDNFGIDKTQELYRKADEFIKRRFGK